MEKWRDGAAFELKEREAEWILKFQICVNRERLLLLPRRRHRRPRPRPSPAVEVSTASATYLAVAIFGAKEGKRPSASVSVKGNCRLRIGVEGSVGGANIMAEGKGGKVEENPYPNHIQKGVIGMAACLTATFVLARSLESLASSFYGHSLTN